MMQTFWIRFVQISFISMRLGAAHLWRRIYVGGEGNKWHMFFCFLSVKPGFLFDCL